MNPIASLLSGPFSDVMNAASGLISKFVPDPNAKVQLQNQLNQLDATFRSQMLAADVQLAQEQSKVITAEATSESWLARNWRPILMLTFTFVIAWNYVIAPLTGAHSTPIVPDMWSLLKLGIGGYIGGRSVEKITPAVTDAIVQLKSNK